MVPLPGRTVGRGHDSRSLDPGRRAGERLSGGARDRPLGDAAGRAHAPARGRPRPAGARQRRPGADLPAVLAARARGRDRHGYHAGRGAPLPGTRPADPRSRCGRALRAVSDVHAVHPPVPDRGDHPRLHDRERRGLRGQPGPPGRAEAGYPDRAAPGGRHHRADPRQPGRDTPALPVRPPSHPGAERRRRPAFRRGHPGRRGRRPRPVPAAQEVHPHGRRPSPAQESRHPRAGAGRAARGRLARHRGLFRPELPGPVAGPGRRAGAGIQGAAHPRGRRGVAARGVPRVVGVRVSLAG